MGPQVEFVHAMLVLSPTGLPFGFLDHVLKERPVGNRLGTGVDVCTARRHSEMRSRACLAYSFHHFVNILVGVDSN